LARIFISYARPEAEVAERIAASLGKAGHDVWFDAQLLAHRDFSDSIEEEIRRADIVLALWSAAATRSQWVRSEANHGREAQKLVQARLEGCTLPMPFDQIHCIDLGRWTGDGEAPAWRAVLASITAALSPVAKTPAKRAPTPATGAQRRQITVLAAAIAEYEQHVRALDPEDLLAITDGFHDVADDIVARFGGQLLRRDEAGLLACFGWPVADEEEAASAVRAALALREAMAGAELPGGGRLAVAAGLATCMVMVGERGPVGPALAEAGDLLAGCAPGSIRVSPATRRIAEDMFAWAGPDTVADARAVASRSHARAARGGTSLIGRSEELAVLLHAWGQAAAGAGQVALLQGDAGIGKSALAEALCQRVVDAGGQVMHWFCGPALMSRPLQPLLAHMAEAAGIDPRSPADERRARLDAWLAQLLPDSPDRLAAIADLAGLPFDAALLPLTGEARRAVALESLLLALAALGRRQPLLLLIEDLHWADPTTLELAGRAVVEAIAQPWLIIGTARPDFRCNWADSADVADLQLAGLAPDEARLLSTRSPGANRFPEPLVRQILERADGNPLHVEEITRAMLEAESAGAELLVPATLQDSLTARLDNLGPAREVASAAAAIGRSFTYTQLATLVPLPPADLRQALREMQRAALIEATGVPPTSRYVFAHALMRDAAYALLPRRQREALHRAIADTLLADSPDLAETDPGLLADHLERAGAGAEAVPLFLAAGGQAAARAAHVEAAQHFRRARALLPVDDPASAPVELQLLLGLGISLAATHGFSHPDVGEALQRARVLCDAMGNVAALFPVVRNLGSFLTVAGDIPAGVAMARSCEAIAATTGLPEHRINACDFTAWTAWVEGRLTDARAALAEGLALTAAHDVDQLPRLTLQDTVAEMNAVLRVVCHAIGDNAGAAAAAAALDARRTVSNDPFLQAFCHFYRAFGDLSTGAFDSAEPHARRAVELCEEQALTSYLLYAKLLHAHATGRQGDPLGAARRARETLAITDSIGQIHTRNFQLLLIGGNFRLADRPEEALAATDEGIESAERIGELFWLPQLYLQRAELLQACSLAGARDAAMKARTLADAQGAARFVAAADGLLAGLQAA
jgi:class 3 adenylate cyclase